MGALPKRKISKGRKNRRRAQDALKSPSLATCPKCNRTKRPHFVCTYCGHYGEKPKAVAKKTVETKTPPKKSPVKKGTTKKVDKKK